jgi:hypothetical protein
MLSLMLSVTYQPLMLNVIMLSVVMLNVVMLSVVTLSVMAPFVTFIRNLDLCQML